MKKIIYNERLKGMIQNRGLKNSWIAQKIGVDSTMITKFINGNRTPSQVRKQLIADILNCKIKDIFKD